MDDPLTRFIMSLLVIAGSLWLAFNFTTGVPAIDMFVSLVFVIIAIRSMITSWRRGRAIKMDVRPRVGCLDHADGSRTELLFIATSNEDEFVAVTIFGEPVTAHEGDQLSVDKIGPGQSIVMDLVQEPREDQ